MIHLLVLAMVLASFSTLFLNIGGGALEAMGRDSSLTGRTDVWKVVLNEAGNPVVGTGFESFWLGPRLQRIWTIRDGWYQGVNEAHDGYLEVYLNLGWIGVILLATILVAGYRSVIARFRRDPDTGRLGLAYFVVIVIYNFTEAGFRMLSVTWLAFLLAAVVTPMVMKSAGAEENASSRVSEFETLRDQAVSWNEEAEPASHLSFQKTSLE